MRVLVLIIAVLAPPLAGVVLSGQALGPYLAFPPMTQPTPSAPLSWPVFVAVAGVGAAALAPFVLRIARAQTSGARPPLRHAFPFWGWAAVAWLGAAWTIAWTRMDIFAAGQEFTFLPVWIGYIVVANALAYRRCGWCPLTDAPGRLLALFPVSGAFWWCFELLNRVARNWHYVGVSDWSPLQYTLIATLSFSTVLPAVLSTFALLSTFPTLTRGLDRGAVISVAAPRRSAWAAFGLAVLALAALGGVPAAVFPAVWVAPLGLIVALRYLTGGAAPFAELARGDWCGVWLAALSALLCGVLWEMWNYHSLAKWEYTVPYVQVLHVFEMPLLGYLGYLPFGLVCIAFIDFLGSGYRRLIARCRRPAAAPAVA